MTKNKNNIKVQDKIGEHKNQNALRNSSMMNDKNNISFNYSGIGQEEEDELLEKNLTDIREIAKKNYRSFGTDKFNQISNQHDDYFQKRENDVLYQKDNMNQYVGGYQLNGKKVSSEEQYKRMYQDSLTAKKQHKKQKILKRPPLIRGKKHDSNRTPKKLKYQIEKVTERSEQ